MMNLQILSEPASTRRIKANLRLAIDETMLTRKISGLHEQLLIVRNQPDQRDRAVYISHELNRLNKQLETIRKSAIDFE